MKYKAIFLDIDGTILKPDHTYTESTKDAIVQLKKKGLEVFIATGRPLHEVRELGEELGVDSYIGYNGAYAEYQNKTIIDEPMSSDFVKKFLRIAKENNHEMVLYTNSKNYFTSLDHPAVQHFNHTFQLKSNALFTEEVIDKIIGITVMNVPPTQFKLYEFDDDLRLSKVVVEGTGTEGAYDVLRISVNKGEAVKKLLNHLHIEKDHTIAFGDGLNDKEMLQAVGESFAMGNAHPELFLHAKHKTTTVSESGIYYGLKKLGVL